MFQASAWKLRPPGGSDCDRRIGCTIFGALLVTGSLESTLYNPVWFWPFSTSRAMNEDAIPDEIHGTDLFEIIRTTRSMRRLKPDPVPNELIRKILEAGVCPAWRNSPIVG